MTTTADRALSDQQLRVLRHMLGIETPEAKYPRPYRNYYCANHDDPEMAELERLGAVQKFNRDKHYDFFRCTEDGRAAAIRSHRTIRMPKGKRLYSKFLEIKDVYQDLTFREFITSERFRETRKMV